MIILESQLGSMEYQFNADIIINSITHWQIELAKSMSTRLDDVKAFVRDCSNGTFPLKDPAQLAFNDFVQVVPSNYYDSLVKSLLLIIPNDVAGAQKSPFGWEHFARRIPQIPTLHPDSVEYLRSGLILAILDVIVRVSSRFNESMIKKDTHTLFVKHAFSFLKTASLKRLAMDHEAKMFEKITARWAIILGDLSVVNSTEILRQVFSVIDLTQKQRTPDEIVLILSSVRYIFTRPSAEESPEVIRLIRELVNHYEKTKKAVVKLAVVQCLEKIVQPIDFTSSDRLEAWESQLFRKLAELYDTLTKWGNTSEDMKAATTRVRVAILANSTYEYFQPTMTTLLVELLSKPKPKSFVFHAILQILRGRFFLDTKDTALSKLLDTFSPVEAYGYMPRPVGEESQQTVADRVRYISEQLFIKRKERVPTDSVDIVVAILLQMAAQSLEVTLQLLTYLMTNKSIENAENCYLGLRAVRTIIDPDTGFLSNAVCSRNDPRFPELINGIPYEFDGHLVALLQFCDTVAGISVLGISGRLIEPGQTKSDDSAAATIAAVTKAASGRASVGSVLNGNSSMSNKIEQMYARGETDLIAMLSESMETMNMRNSMSFTATDSFWNAGPAAETKKILEKDLSNEKIDEQNVIVFEAISDWYVKCGQPKSNVKKFAFSSTLEIGTPSISQPVPIDRIGKERIDLVVILLLFKEIIRMLPFIPQPELVFGKLFTGPYLLHSHLELAQETSISLEKTFVKYPEMRIEIIKAILDLIKHTSLSDISYATIMLHLTALIRHWSKDYQAHLKIFDPDQITRLSCKLDACLLIMMARPNPRIRHASLSALSEFYTISQAVLPHPNEPGFLPLQAILDQRASYLSKNAMYAFMERDLLGHKITPKVIGQITLLPLSTIASSDYSYAFKFYLGELARQFSLSGRPKALRHCAKFLTSLAVPYMTSVTTVDSEFVITYSNYMVLMMALAGVPLKSEDGYTLDSYSEADHLLFNNFRHFLSPILNSENTWEIRAIVQASYFIHISLYQLYVVHLWQWYAETRQNSIAELNPRMIDNILYAIRSLSQNRDFEIIAREPSVFQSSIIEIIVDFIRMTQITLQNLDFRSETGILRTKLAINFASVSARLAYSVFTAQRFILDEQDVYIDGVSRPSMFLDITFPGLGWDPQPRQSALLLLKDLTTAVESSVGTDLTVPKMAHYQRILIDKIGVATEMLLVLGDVFDGDALPADLLLWLSKLQRSGFNVYPPPLLYNYENALGTVLAYSYSLAGNTSGFLSAVFNQV
ncbi:hypothetical protein HK100_003069 [Physocladia obscura]|uniref:Cell morphogenesis protein N-terminal domain-containing protein n=1 Tax=Physocladia obscura TaxID=109957 RepID=A0AAD5T8H8_9FUNG|nr:hypothetical protein HK100_003069 [Physocladia obscura]